jgi:hypothetical protein
LSSPVATGTIVFELRNSIFLMNEMKEGDGIGNAMETLAG